METRTNQEEFIYTNIIKHLADGGHSESAQLGGAEYAIEKYRENMYDQKGPVYKALLKIAQRYAQLIGKKKTKGK